MSLEKVALISNSLSSTVVFRRSLVAKLREAERLAAILSTRDDRSHIEAGGEGLPIVLLTGSGVKERLDALISAASQIRASNARILHGFTHAGNAVASMIWLINGGRLVLSITGMGRAFSSGGVVNIFLRGVILLYYAVMQFFVARLIVQNRDDEKLMSMIFLPRNRGKIVVTNGSGVDLGHFAGISARREENNSACIHVGFFSRALPEKGVDDFYRLAKAKENEMNLCFHHWGHYGTGVYVRESIQAHARRNNVHFHGFSVDPREHIIAMDLIVLPSGYREGLSRLAIEAMLAGKVLVARSTTGVRDHLTDGETAFVYAGAEDLVQAFDRAIIADLDGIGAAAMAYAREAFDVNRVDLAYMEAYGFSKPTQVVGAA